MNINTWKEFFFQVQVPTVLHNVPFMYYMVNSFCLPHSLKVTKPNLLYNEDREPWLLVTRGIHLKRSMLVPRAGKANLIDTCHQGHAEGSSTLCTGNDEEGGKVE